MFWPTLKKLETRFVNTTLSLSCSSGSAATRSVGLPVPEMILMKDNCCGKAHKGGLAEKLPRGSLPKPCMIPDFPCGAASSLPPGQGIGRNKMPSSHKGILSSNSSEGRATPSEGLRAKRRRGGERG